MTEDEEKIADTDPGENAGVVKPQKAGLNVGVLISFALVLALLGFLAWGLRKAQAGQVSSGIAPDFSLTGFDGRQVNLSELRGQVVIINFWASWCVPCREEAAYLEQTWRKYKDQEVVFIGVDYVDTEKAALAYIEEFDITYINGPDLGTEVSDAYNIKGVPETFYVSKSGELKGLHVGPLKAPELDQKIEELLAESYPGN
jgi:cytochrome c biogenesis protein CcmG/thiol:disulfide interchange protein DsbE